MIRCELVIIPIYAFVPATVPTNIGSTVFAAADVVVLDDVLLDDPQPTAATASAAPTGRAITLASRMNPPPGGQPRELVPLARVDRFNLV
jgi:predicted secreted protein